MFLAVRQEMETVHELLRQVADDQTGRDGRLDAIESERASLHRELQGFQFDQEELRKDVLERFERFQAEMEGLRAELMAKLSSPPPVETRPAPAEVRPTPLFQAAVPPAPPFVSVLDELAQDLALDLLFRDGRRPEPRSPAVVPAIPTVPPAAPDITPEYKQLRDQFARAIDRGDQAGAIAAARLLVSYTRDHFGERRLEHALWLRNLAMSLSSAGEAAEALVLLPRALDICEANPDADPFPHAICLIDLAELYLAAGNDRQAKPACQRALEILKKLNVGPGSPLVSKAQHCLARIGTMDVDLSSFNSVSILT